MIFTKEDYDKLATLFNEGYSGYRPDVVEIPNGNGIADAGKRYLHVSLKHNPPDWAIEYLARAHFEACKIAEQIDVPAEFYPRVENATLRVLDYPAGAGTEEHTDFDLFTVNCYESGPGLEYEFNPGYWELHCDKNPNAKDYHFGEIGEIVGLGKADAHRLPPVTKPRQSIVYFAMPSFEAHLRIPYEITSTTDFSYVKVGDWLKERYARSRTYK